MEGLVLDIENVRTRALPDIKKAGDRVQDAYNASIILKTKLPSNFSYRDIVGKIGSSIHDVKKEIDNVDLIVNKKLAQIIYSESRANARAAQIASAINSISAKDGENKKKVSFAASTAVKAGVERVGKNTSNSGAKMVSKSETAIKDLNNKSGEKLKAIGLVAIKMGTGTALGGVAAVNNFGNKVFDFAKTGAKTFIKTASIINNFSSRIAVDVSKKIGSKVTNGIKTASKWVKETSKSVTSWLSDKFNSAKSWANNKIKETGAWIDKTFKAIWAFNNEVFNFVWDKMKKVGASIANGFLAFIKGILHLWEALEKLGAIYLSCKATIVTGLIDIVRGITTGKWDWKLTKELWKTTKSIVTYQYVNKAYDWFYSTKVGRTLDNYAYKPFKSDGLVCQILDGVGYATGIIIVSVCTFGAATPAFLAIIAGSAGIGKYTAEEWNKNSLSISYEGQELELKIDYEKYLEITSLKAGESATIEQQFQDANGGVSKITFKIIANGDGTYSVTDDNENQFEFNGVKESSTAKGLGIGTLKGLWEGAQYYIGAKIGATQFSNILGNISNPVIQQLTRSGMRIGLDGITGALEVPFQTVVTVLSEGVSWKEAWNSQGGWDAVRNQFIIGAGMSSLGEAFSFKGNLRTTKINKWLLSGDPQLINKNLRNMDVKYVADAINQLPAADFKKLIDVEIFNNLDSSIQSIIINSLTLDQIINLSKNVDDKALINIININFEENNILKTLEIISNLDGNQFDKLLKNLDNVKSNTKVSKFFKDMSRVYGEGNVAAQTKYREFFKNFREHGIKHATNVAYYSTNIGKNMDNVDIDEIIYSALAHDFGMRGGYVYVDDELFKKIVEAGGNASIKGKYIQIDSLSELKFYELDKTTGEKKLVTDFLDNCTRKSHPLNSALSILTDVDTLPTSVDKDIAALLAMTHSKSTSGIRHFSSMQEWMTAIDKLESALKCYNSDNGTAYSFNADRIRKMISNPDDFVRLQKEALAIRDGDAMAKVVEHSAGNIKGILMQDGTISVARTTEIRENYNTPILSPDEEYSLIIDEIYDSSGNKIRELDSSIIKERFSKKIHIGESNLDFDSSYLEGDYKAIISVKNANQTPNATFDAIEERIGEVNTYTNCRTRSFEIVLPKDAKGTALGNWYEETLESLKSDPAKKHLKFDAQVELDKKIITQQEYNKQLSFYDNLRIVYK